ncbi:AfsR/SARP family transcriptional regulator [Catellatospora methionotrophica]|uniref:AfsR/SARP family transcriptional regulator n=1 Tax=Catellatospora methionotrophica TaxID=121620 RepID=UPI00340F50E8
MMLGAIYQTKDHSTVLPGTERIRVRLLGPIAVVINGAQHSVPGLRRRAILSVLAMHSGRVVSVDKIIDVVWGGNAPVTAINALQSHVSYLRRHYNAGGAITACSSGYVLDLQGGLTDLQMVEQLIGQARELDDPTAAAHLLRAALAVWRGPSLADVVDLCWFDNQAGRLERMRHTAVKSLAEAQLALGEHALIVPDLEDLADQHPFDEQIHGQLMLALYRAGRQVDALAVYRGLRDRLRRELGVDPMPMLRNLELAVLRQDTALAMRPHGTLSCSQ